MRSSVRPRCAVFRKPRAGSLIAALSSGKQLIRPGSWFSSRSHGIAPQHGIRWWSSPKYGSGCAECSASHRPARDRPASAPSGHCFPPPGREFRSGYGLLFPLELGFSFPKCQHKHCEFASGGNCRLGEASSRSKSDSPAFQR